jgi:hypothetical protein
MITLRELSTVYPPSVQGHEQYGKEGVREFEDINEPVLEDQPEKIGPFVTPS